MEENWTSFKNILLEARDKFVPHRLSTSRHNLPWYTQNLRRQCNKKQRLYNKSKKTKSKDDIKAFKQCRGEYNRLLKNARRDYYQDFLDPRLDENSKFLFNYIKRLKKDSVGIEALNYKGKLRRFSKLIVYVHFSHILSYGYQGIEWHFIRNPAKGLKKNNFKVLNLSFKSEKSDCLLVECTLLVHVG